MTEEKDHTDYKFNISSKPAGGSGDLLINGEISFGDNRQSFEFDLYKTPNDEFNENSDTWAMIVEKSVNKVAAGMQGKIDRLEQQLRQSAQRIQNLKSHDGFFVEYDEGNPVYFESSSEVEEYIKERVEYDGLSPDDDGQWAVFKAHSTQVEIERVVEVNVYD